MEKRRDGEAAANQSIGINGIDGGDPYWEMKMDSSTERRRKKLQMHPVNINLWRTPFEAKPTKFHSNRYGMNVGGALPNPIRGGGRSGAIFRSAFRSISLLFPTPGKKEGSVRVRRQTESRGAPCF